MAATFVNDRPAVLKCAKAALGFGFDFERNATLEKVFRDYSDEEINLVESSLNYSVLHESSCDFENELVQKYGFKASAALAKLPIGISAHADYEKMNSQKSESRDLNLTVICIRQSLCSLNRYPKFSEAILRNANAGDGLVVASTVYVGYRVDVKFEQNEFKNDGKSNVSIDSGVKAKHPLLDLIGSVDLNGKFSRLRNMNDNNGQFSCSAHLEGFGWSTPAFEERFTDASSLLAALKALKNEFLNHLPNFDARCNAIEMSGVLPYSNFIDVDVNCIRDIADNMVNNMTESQRSEFISNGLKLDSDKNLNLESVLEKIQTVMNPSISRANEYANSNASKSNKKVLVVGESGTGKSTMIGYLMGYKMHKVELNGISVVDYVDTEVRDPRPAIGHNPAAAMTKGCSFFSCSTNSHTFIDSGGMLDTEGPEADLTNAMSLDLVLKNNSCDAIMIVLTSADILQGRDMTGLKKILSRLGRVIANPMSEAHRSSIFFVFNDKREHDCDKVKNELMVRIRAEITNLDEKIQKALPPKLLKAWRQINPNVLNSELVEDPKSLSQIFGSINDIASQTINESVQKTINDWIDQLHVLSALMTIAKSNIIVANFLDNGACRINILSAIDTMATTLKYSPMTPSYLYEDRVPAIMNKFKTILATVCSYSNQVKTEKQAQDNKVKEIDKKIKARKNLKNTDKLTLEDKISLELKEIQRELREKENKKQDLERQKKILENDINLKDLVTLSASNGPIAPRWFIASDWLATRYAFNNIATTNAVAETYSPTAHVAYPGRFFPETGENNAVSRWMYRPAWYGYEEDAQAVVKLKVRTCDHVTTKEQINVKVKMINEITDEILALKRNEEQCNEPIPSAPNPQQVEMSLVQLINEITQEIEDLQKQRQSASDEVSKESKDPKYAYFTQLTEIVHASQLIQSNFPSEKQVFQSFLVTHGQGGDFSAKINCMTMLLQVIVPHVVLEFEDRIPSNSVEKSAENMVFTETPVGSYSVPLMATLAYTYFNDCNCIIVDSLSTTKDIDDIETTIQTSLASAITNISSDDFLLLLRLRDETWNGFYINANKYNPKICWIECSQTDHLRGILDIIQDVLNDSAIFKRLISRDDFHCINIKSLKPFDNGLLLVEFLRSYLLNDSTESNYGNSDTETNRHEKALPSDIKADNSLVSMNNPNSSINRRFNWGHLVNRDGLGSVLRSYLLNDSTESNFGNSDTDTKHQEKALPSDINANNSLVSMNNPNSSINRRFNWGHLVNRDGDWYICSGEWHVFQKNQSDMRYNEKAPKIKCNCKEALQEHVNVNANYDMGFEFTKETKVQGLKDDGKCILC